MLLLLLSVWAFRCVREHLAGLAGLTRAQQSLLFHVRSIAYCKSCACTSSTKLRRTSRTHTRGKEDLRWVAGLEREMCSCAILSSHVGDRGQGQKMRYLEVNYSRGVCYTFGRGCAWLVQRLHC